MQVQEQLKKLGLADKLDKLILLANVIETWLFVFGFVLVGIVVAICRELKRVA